MAIRQVLSDNSLVQSLNYHHLHLFRQVARQENLTKASKILGLTPQTVSTQVRDLEEALNEKLFDRVGRKLILTDIGRVVLGYAEEIFSTGQELQEVLRGQVTERPLKLLVGVANMLPKLIVHKLIEPALRDSGAVRVVCHEGSPEQLLVELTAHRLDVVLSDSPIRPQEGVKAYNHALGNCGVTFMAPRKVAERLRKNFPSSLNGEPVLLPTDDAALRRALDAWFNRNGIHVRISGEFEDSALLKAFGQAGVGFFAIPQVIEQEVARQYNVESFGSPDGVSEKFYAISVERRLRHAGTVAICKAARSELFAKQIMKKSAQKPKKRPT